jgi:prepilin-type N-terminal cleavage/methylation domain-containing protein
MNVKRDRLHTCGGFTLLELMVVVAIIAFVTAAAVPSFAMALQRNRLREAGVLIVEAVFAARSRAARTGRCHQVLVAPDNPKVSGGSGGWVAVQESNMAECSRAANSGVWTSVWVKSVGGGNALGQNRAGVVGNDVAISAMLGAANNPDTVLFEPSGGLYVRTNGPRTYFLTMYTTAGAVRGVNRRVTITSGGSVRYSGG